MHSGKTAEQARVLATKAQFGGPAQTLTGDQASTVEAINYDIHDKSVIQEVGVEAAKPVTADSTAPVNGAAKKGGKKAVKKGGPTDTSEEDAFFGTGTVDRQEEDNFFNTHGVIGL